MTGTLRDKLIQKGWVTPFNADTLVRLIEEHYADEPAVPASREPTAVTGQPNWRGLCEELLQALEGEGYANWADGPDGNPLIENARAVLTRWGNLKESLTSSPPADGEVAECAAELLQRQAMVPVAVSERLPGAEDCDAEGRCWWGTPSFANNYTVTQSAQWRLCAPDDRFGSELFWRPAHALPLPGVNNG